MDQNTIKSLDIQMDEVRRMVTQYFQPPPWYKNMRVHGVLMWLAGGLTALILPQLERVIVEAMHVFHESGVTPLPFADMMSGVSIVVPLLFIAAGTVTYLVGIYRLCAAVESGMLEPAIGAWSSFLHRREALRDMAKQTRPRGA